MLWSGPRYEINLGSIETTIAKTPRRANPIKTRILFRVATLRIYPVQKHTNIKADDPRCAMSLGNVCSTNRPFTYSEACNVPPFAIGKLL